MRSKLSTEFQHFNLWAHMMALQNVIGAPMQVLGQPRGQAVARAEALLCRVGVHRRKDVYPSRRSTPSSSAKCCV